MRPPAAAAVALVLALLAGCEGGVVGDAAPGDEWPVLDGGRRATDGGAPDTDGGASRLDGGSLTDASSTTPDGGVYDGVRVPMFVAFGHAARTLTSCDGGESWVGEHAFEADGHDHSEYAGLGRMAWGRGRFVGCAGWGHPTRVVTSEDGIEWSDLPDGAFVLEDGSTERPGVGCAGVVWDGSGFAFASGDRLFTSDDGLRWTRSAQRLPGTGSVRAVGGGEGLLVIVREVRAYLSDDGGRTWFEGDGWDDACGARAQRGGGIVIADGRVLIGGRDGDVCVSSDRGHHFTASFADDFLLSITWTGSEYVGVARAGELIRSTDGLRWTPDSHDAGTDLAAISYADGKYVAVSRDARRFFVATDPSDWTEAASDGVDDDALLTIVHGLGRPSAACPAP